MKKLLLLILLVQEISGCSLRIRPGDFHKTLWAAEWHPGGKSLVVGGNLGEVFFLDANSLAVTQRMPVKGTVTNLQFDPFYGYLAVGTQLSESGSFLATPYLEGSGHISLKGLPETGIRGMAHFGEGSSSLLVGDNEGRLHFMNVMGEKFYSIQADPKAITSLSWNPEEKLVVTTGSRVSIVQTERSEINSIQPRDQEVLLLCSAWHPSGEWFAIGDYGDHNLDMPAQIQFRRKDGTLIRAMDVSKSEIRNIAWIDGGEHLVSVSDRIRIWSKKGALLRSKSLGAKLWGLAISPNGTKIAVTTTTGEVIILNTRLKVLKRKSFFQ